MHLSEHGDKMKFDLRVAKTEANYCDDLVNQAAYHIRRATIADEQLKSQQAEQEKERLALKQRQEKEEEEKRLKREQEAQELLQKRQTFLEKTKNLLNIGEAPMDEPAKKSKSRKKNYDIYSGGSGDEGADRSSSKPPKPRKSGGSGATGGSRREKEKRPAPAYRRMTKEEIDDLNSFIDDGDLYEG